MQSRVEYEERSGWSWWVHLMLLGVLVAVVWPVADAAGGGGGEGGASATGSAAVLRLLLGLGIPLLFYTFVGQLRTRVRPEGVELSWGLAGVIRKTIPFEEIQAVEAVTYSPLKEFGGWGLRFGGRGKQAWTTRGNRAAVLTLANGTRFYLGSDRPERVIQWIQMTMAKRKRET